MGYGVFGRRGRAPEYWLTLALGGGWVAAYRVTYHGEGARRRVRIEELRVVPGRTGRDADFHPGMRSATRPDTRFSFDAVRRRITARYFADAFAAIQIPEDDDPAEWGAPPPATTGHPTRRGAGRPPRPRIFYAKFAVRYHYVEHDMRRNPGQSTRDLLAAEYKVPITTIAKWIRTARHHGLLTPVVRGQRGGMKTRLAEELSATKGHK